MLSNNFLPSAILAAKLSTQSNGTTDPADKEEPRKKNFKDEKEKTAYWMSLRQKYGDVLAKRMQWLDWADSQLPTGNTPRELALKHAKMLNLDPEYLLSSAMEEGIGNRWPSRDGYLYDHSDAYVNANTKGELKGYDVDGFRSYGLDTIGDRMKDLIRGGYLPADFVSKIKPYKALNEIEEKKKQKGLPFHYVTTAAFKDDDAAFAAKAAIMAQERDQLNNYLKKKNITLSPDAQKFFMLAAYNGGGGNAVGMLKEYQAKGLLNNDGFLKSRPQTSSFNQIYDNVMPRLVGGKMFRGEGYFDEDQNLAQQAPPIVNKLMAARSSALQNN